MATFVWTGTTSNNPTVGSNWNVGGVAQAAPPTAADDVAFGTGTGATNNACTVPSATTIVGRSYDFTGYTGTFTMAATTSQMSVGDATAGAGNIAIKFVPGMTLTLTGIGQINLVSTSATVQTIDSGGKTMPALIINGAGSSYQLTGNNYTTGGAMTLTAGTFDQNGKNCQANTWNPGTGSATRTWTPGSGTTFTVTATTGATNFVGTTTTGLTVTANSCTLIFSASTTGGANFGGFNWNGLSFTMNSAAQSTPTITFNGATLANFSWTGPATKTSTPVFVGNLTCTSDFSWNGNSAVNKSILAPSLTVFGTAITITAATATVTNVDLKDITFSVAGSFTVTSVGDCGGVSGITVTPATTQTHDGTTSNWSTAARWTSRVPLPQDTVVIPSGSGTITLDMPRGGTGVDFTGFTGTFTMSLNIETYGSWTFATGMTVNGTTGIQFAARTSVTITTAGKTIPAAGIVFQGPGGQWTMQDALTTTGSTTHTDGTIITNGFTYTTLSVTSSGTRTRAITLSTSTVNLTSTATATVWNMTATGLTLSAASSTIVLSTTATNTRTFTGGAFNYGTVTYTVSGSTGQMTFSSAQFINTFNFSDSSNARTVAFTSVVTFVFRNFNVFGTSGKLMTVKASTAASAAFIDLIGPVNTTMDYLSIQDIFSGIPGKFYAGANSTSVSGNTNINIAAAPSPGLYIDFMAGAGASGSSTTLTLPSYLVPTSGELIHLFYGATSNPATINTPSGYTTDAAGGISTKQFKKISDGTETGVTVTSSGSPSATGVHMVVIGGFTGTPTYDVTDANSSGAATSLSSTATTGPTNTGTPAISLAFFQGNGNIGNPVSATNSYEFARVLVSSGNTLAKSLSSTGAQSTTFTWTTSRSPQSLLVVYKDVASGSNYTQSPSDTITMSDAAVKAVTHPLADTITLSDAVAKAIGLVKADTITLTDVMVKSAGKQLADVMTMSDMAALVSAFVRTTADTLVLSDNATPSTVQPQNYSRTVNDTLSMLDHVSIDFSGRTGWYERNGDTWYARDPQSWYTKP